jgi:hypothetical protein
VDIEDRMREHGEVTGLIEYSRLAMGTTPTARARLYLGQIEPLQYVLPFVEYLSTVAETSEGETAGDLLDRLSSWKAWFEPGLEVAVPVLCATGELSVAARHEAAARLVLAHLRDAPLVTSGLVGGPVCIARLLGDLAVVLGNTRDVRVCYEEALEVCDRMGLRPEKALTALGLAELLLDGDGSEQPRAREHLDFAIAEFTEMKMQPALERSLAHKELLKA